QWVGSRPDPQGGLSRPDVPAECQSAACDSAAYPGLPPADAPLVPHCPPSVPAPAGSARPPRVGHSVVWVPAPVPRRHSFLVLRQRGLGAPGWPPRPPPRRVITLHAPSDG